MLTTGRLEAAPPLEHIRVSAEARERLIQLKRRTGIQRWNTLCRWAFCRSLAEPTAPPVHHVPSDSNVEMDWKTFAGPYSDLIVALLRFRCQRDGLPSDSATLATQFKLHLHRGLAYLAADRRIADISDLMTLALSVPRKGTSAEA